jgi:two-component system, cell cycle sensor histidine kinase and response regulator CckA
VHEQHDTPYGEIVESLRQSQQRLQFFLDHAPGAMAMFDREMRYLAHNRQWQRQYVSPGQSVIGRSHYDVFPDLRADWREAHRLGMGGGVTRVEREQIDLPDGSIVWLRWEVQPWYDAGGAVGGIVLFVEDITARVATEEAARLARQDLDELIATIDGIVWEADAQTFAFLFVSAQAERLLGYPVSRWLGDPGFWAAHIHPDDREASVRYCLECTRANRDHHFDYRMIAADGRVVWLQDRVTVHAVGGTPTRLRGVMVDITERKQLEAQLRQAQKMEAMGTLAGGIAHDFNNILAAIGGNIELVAMDLGGGHPSLANIDEIRRAVRRASELVDRILTFSRPETHGQRAIQLGPVVVEGVQLLRSLIPAGVELTQAIAPDLPDVQANATQVHQVIVNLVTNAWQAMDGGPGRVAVALGTCMLDAPRRDAHGDLPPGCYVCLSVEDTGHGMDAATIERIFEPFFTTRDAGRATGLGLSMVHGIARGHGGAVLVDSEPRRGSTFTVLFPVAVGEPAGALEPPDVSEVPRGQGERVLYVDDEAQLVTLSVNFLERLGYRVEGYVSPHEALASFRRQPDAFDLVVTDYNMPGLSGLDVAIEVAGLRPSTPVLLASGYMRPAEAQQATALGIGAILPKPYTFDELGAAVHRQLQARRVEE